MHARCARAAIPLLSRNLYVISWGHEEHPNSYNTEKWDENSRKGYGLSQDDAKDTQREVGVPPTDKG